MAILQSTNVQGTLCVNGVAVGGGKSFKYCCFTGSTTFTPSQDLIDGDGVIDTIMVAGGGGGGGAKMYNRCNSRCGWAMGGGGGSGEVIHHSFDITSTDACTITIGAGGQSGSMDGTLVEGDGGTNVSSGKGGNTAAFGATALVVVVGTELPVLGVLLVYHMMIIELVDQLVVLY